VRARLVVFRLEQASECGAQPERVEVGARHPDPIADGRFVSERDAGPEDPVSGNTGEHGLRALEVTEHRVAPDDPVATPRLVTRVVALDGSWELQGTQVVGRHVR